MAINLLVGCGLDDHNMLVLLIDAATFTVHIKEATFEAAQGFYGVGFYHYFGPIGRSAYITGGIGIQRYNSRPTASNSNGLGILLGGGYEFARHFQLHATFSFGQTSDSGVDIDHQQLMVEISALAF